MKLTIKNKNGVIPSFFKHVHCYLWEGHVYKRVSPEYQGRAVYECVKCGYKTVM